jgi:hypothetical protein
MVATTKLLVCLLSDITSVADTVAKNATTLRDERIQSFFGLVSGTTLKPDSIFSSFPEAIVIVYSYWSLKMLCSNGLKDELL